MSHLDDQAIGAVIYKYPDPCKLEPRGSITLHQGSISSFGTVQRDSREFPQRHPSIHDADAACSCSSVDFAVTAAHRSCDTPTLKAKTRSKYMGRASSPFDEQEGVSSCSSSIGCPVKSAAIAPSATATGAAGPEQPSTPPITGSNNNLCDWAAAADADAGMDADTYGARDNLSRFIMEYAFKRGVQAAAAAAAAATCPQDDTFELNVPAPRRNSYGPCQSVAAAAASRRPRRNSCCIVPNAQYQQQLAQAMPAHGSRLRRSSYNDPSTALMQHKQQLLQQLKLVPQQQQPAACTTSLLPRSSSSCVPDMSRIIEQQQQRACNRRRRNSCCVGPDCHYHQALGHPLQQPTGSSSSSIMGTPHFTKPRHNSCCIIPDSNYQQQLYQALQQAGNGSGSVGRCRRNSYSTSMPTPLYEHEEEEEQQQQQQQEMQFSMPLPTFPNAAGSFGLGSSSSSSWPLPQPAPAAMQLGGAAASALAAAEAAPWMTYPFTDHLGIVTEDPFMEPLGFLNEECLSNPVTPDAAAAAAIANPGAQLASLAAYDAGLQLLAANSMYAARQAALQTSFAAASSSNISISLGGSSCTAFQSAADYSGAARSSMQLPSMSDYTAGGSSVQLPTVSGMPGHSCSSMQLPTMYSGFASNSVPLPNASAAAAAAGAGGVMNVDMAFAGSMCQADEEPMGMDYVPFMHGDGSYMSQQQLQLQQEMSTFMSMQQQQQQLLQLQLQRCYSGLGAPFQHNSSLDSSSTARAASAARQSQQSVYNVAGGCIGAFAAPQTCSRLYKQDSMKRDCQQQQQGLHMLDTLREELRHLQQLREQLAAAAAAAPVGTAVAAACAAAEQMHHNVLSQALSAKAAVEAAAAAAAGGRDGW